jgi:prepilin-type N-terminal cleavage/methylation domain-containing protein
MRRLRDTGGFTLVEVLTAMVILVVALGGITYFFASNNDSSLASQREVTQLSVIQQQLENVHQLVKQYGFSALALSGNPAQPTDSSLPVNPTDPNDFITGWGTASEAFRVESDYNKTTVGVITGSPSSGETLLDPINGSTGGQVTPVLYTDLSTGTTYTNLSSLPTADPYAIVNTYVTDDSTVGCNTANSNTCAATDARRVIVAVTLHQLGGRNDLGPNKPAYASTVFTNPSVSYQTAQASGLTILGLIP